ncbi:MAG: hypothetical protein IV090_06820 [Candidatus Sericytochromatia bacterium]|jgi:hypothetical protein|nr:hypothetical protein [Candidatus Sericytochromatia bacterium]
MVLGPTTKSVLVLLACIGCNKNLPVSEISSKPSSAATAEPLPTPSPVNTDDGNCHILIEVDKESGHYIGFETGGANYIMPLKTIFKNCPFKIEDIAEHIFSFSYNGAIYVISKETQPDPKYVNTKSQPSYCALYGFTHQANIELFTETKLKNGEFIKGVPFLLQLDAARIKNCETPGMLAGSMNSEAHH